MKINSLMSALPISGIESQQLARIGDFLLETGDGDRPRDIIFFEPPAGKHVPYINPVEAMSVMLRTSGMATQDANAIATNESSRLLSRLSLFERPRLYSFFETMNVPECVPVPVLVDYLRNRSVFSVDITGFLEKACDVIYRIRTLRMTDNCNEPVLLSELPSLPPPKAMIEFFVGLQNDIAEEIDPKCEWMPLPPALLAWRESMRPVAERLEKVIGEKVYHFQDLDDELDDDCCHRFLALHCWCSLLPESNFVKYLLEATGFEDVEELKAALIDPDSYTHPFLYNYAFVGIEPVNHRFRYLLPDQKRRVGIAFRTEAAKQRAGEIALEQIGAEILFLAPRDLITEDWRKEVTIHGYDYGVWHDFDKPITFLAEIDEIYVVSDEDRPSRGFDLKVGPELEVLMWRAHQWGVPLFSDEPAAWRLGNPETCLERTGVPERVADIDTQRQKFTQELQCLVVNSDYGSSGLWDDNGRNIPYDLIDLPFALIKRLSAWQENYNNTLIPLLPGTADDEWWDKHLAEKKDIVVAIQDVLGDKINLGYWND